MMVKSDAEMEKIKEKIEKARSLVAVIWEENSRAMKELPVPAPKEEMSKYSTEDHSPLIIQMMNVGLDLDDLLVDLDRLREAIDL